MNETEILIRKHSQSSFNNQLFNTYATNPDIFSIDNYIELGKFFREVNDNRFQVWVYEDTDSNERKYRYQIMSTYRKFLDDFNRIVGNNGLNFRQVRRFTARYKNRALIIKNLYEKIQHKQIYSTISEKMWNTVLGVGKNTQFINALIDCGAVVRVYNASGTRKIGSIYSLNPKIITQLFDAFNSIPDFWAKCQAECEIDTETFEELGNGQYSETVSVFQDNAEDNEDTHANFVSFCANKKIMPPEEILSEITTMIADKPYSSGWNVKLYTLDNVAQVYSYLKDWVSVKTDLAEIRQVANKIYTNAHNYIKYTPSIHISNKEFHGIGIRAVTELCTKPKYETVCKQIDRLDMSDELIEEYKKESYVKSREYILDRYGELDHFDVTSSIPHIMYLMNYGKYTNEDLYYILSGKPDWWNGECRTMIKQCYMQAHFSDASVRKIYNNIKFKCAEKGDYRRLDWYGEHEDFVLNFIANVKAETPDGKSTMDFYHESNVFILLRKLWTDRGIKTIGQVYDSFWFEKGKMSQEQFEKDLVYVAESYYNKFGVVPFNKIV